MTLHEAIITVIKKNNGAMSAKEIAEQINISKIYQRNDGSLVPTSQINDRISKYPNLFLKDENNLINVTENKVTDLLKLFSDFQSEYNKVQVSFFGGIIFSQQVIPFVFFFKRMCDNPELSKKHFSKTFNCTSEIENDLFAFLNYLNSSPLSSFNGKLKVLINDFEGLFTSPLKDFFRSEIVKFDFSINVISVLDFGKFFNELIYNTTKQNVKIGEFTTPRQIAELFFDLCKNEITPNTNIYNPGAGFSTIPSLFAQKLGLTFNFSGEEIIPNIYLLSLMNLISNDILTNNFYNTNSLLENNNNQKFDLIISVPPFGGLDEFENNLKYPPKFKTTNTTALFVNHIVSSLKENGKAIVLVAESLLYSHEKSYCDLRKYIVSNRLLEGVISLPNGILKPYTGIKTSILVLSKRNNESSFFIDGNDSNFYLLDKNGQVELFNNVLVSEYERYVNVSGFISQTIAEYGKVKSTLIPLSKISHDLYDLNVNRYLFQNDPEIDSSKIQLADIVSQYIGGGIHLRDDLKYVNITDLNNTFYDFYLNEDKLSIINKNQKGNFIDIPVLLVGSIQPNIKPTYFSYKQEPIIVSRNIHVFRVDKNKVDVEYLIFELSSGYIKEHISAISVGVTSLRRFSVNDFLKLKINLPTLEKQKEIVKLKKEALLLEKSNEVRIFAEKAGLSAKNEIELLGFVKHEIGNISPGISNDIINLQSFLKRKEIDFSERISDRKNAPSLNSVFNRISANISDIENLMSNIQNIIDFGNSETKNENFWFKAYFKEELNKLNELLKDQNVNVFIGLDNEFFNKKVKDYLFEIDGKQFSFVIRNFVLNSLKHGYKNKDVKKNIVFNLSVEEDFYYLSMINDGEPFSQDFTLSNFLSFGGRKDKTKGSGLGGYLINKVIQNHNGTIELMEAGTAIFIDAPAEEPRFMDNNFIKVGVHFLIKLPNKITNE